MSSFYNQEHKYCDQVWGFTGKAVYSWAGEPYKTANADIPDKWKGKRIAVPARDAPFSKLDYKGEPYGAGGYIRYSVAGGGASLPQKVYPAPAFGSKDFTKTDEFSGYSRMVTYREQVSKELKVAEKALQRAAAMTLSASGELDASGSSGEGGADSPTTPTRTSRMARTREFASPTQFDRLRDHRSTKEIYHTEGYYKASHSPDFGASQTAYMSYSEDLPTADEMRNMTSPYKRVAVTKQFYRGNGTWAAITGAMP